MCVVCTELPVDAIAESCQHAVACHNCAAQMDMCPICKIPLADTTMRLVPAMVVTDDWLPSNPDALRNRNGVELRTQMSNLNVIPHLPGQWILNLDQLESLRRWMSISRTVRMVIQNLREHKFTPTKIHENQHRPAENGRPVANAVLMLVDVLFAAMPDQQDEWLNAVSIPTTDPRNRTDH